MRKTLRNTILKWMLLVALMAYAACITVWANKEADNRRIRAVEIVVENATIPGSDVVTERGVEQALRQKYAGTIIGKPIHSIRTGEIENYLRRLKSLEDVQCIVTADRRLEIRVTPMMPEIRVFCGGRSWYVNKDGKAVVSDPGFFVDVPVVSGNFRRGFQPAEVLPLVRFVRNDPDMDALVSMIVARDAHNLLLVPRTGGHIINFGDTSRLAEKKHNLLTFYRNVIPYKGWEEYDTVSVKFRNQVVATRRNKAAAWHGAVDDDEIDPEESTLPDAGISGRTHTASDSTRNSNPTAR